MGNGSPFFPVARMKTRATSFGFCPQLTAQGVAGALEDTILESHDKDGVLITEHGDWKETQQSEIEAILPPTEDRESAILMTMVPSNYTAIVRGKNDTAGVALVEVQR